MCNTSTQSCRSCAILASAKYVSSYLISKQFIDVASLLVDIDILKPDTGKVHIERPSHSASASVNETPETTTPDLEPIRPYAEPNSEGEEDEERAVTPAQDEGNAAGLSGDAVLEAIAQRNKMLAEDKDNTNTANIPARISTETLEDEDEEYSADDERVPFLRGRRNTRGQQETRTGKGGDSSVRALSIDPLAPSQAFDQTFKNRLAMAAASERGQHGEDESEIGDLEDERAQGQGQGSRTNGDDRELVRFWKSAPGQRIAVPVRIEPKVYFASERTFLVGYFFPYSFGFTQALSLLSLLGLLTSFCFS